MAMYAYTPIQDIPEKECEYGYFVLANSIHEHEDYKLVVNRYLD